MSERNSCAHTNVPEYIRLIAQGRFTESYMLNRKSNVFPGIEERFPLPSAAECVPGGPSVACSTPEALAWDPELSAVTDPSGRAVRGVHRAAY